MAAGATLELRVQARDADAEELDRLARQLMQQLLELDVDSVETLRGEAPPEGSKALDLAILGGLIVRYGPSAVPTVVNAVRTWVNRDARRSVTLEIGERKITLDAATPEQQAKLVDAFLAEAGT
jgi:hypothetical protein